MADIVAEIKKIPPVTRFLVLSSLGVTVPAVLGLAPVHKLLFLIPFITKKWEIWRIYTSMFFGTTGLGYLFHLVMLYLENMQYERRSSDYAWQLFLASLGIIIINRPLNSMVHDHAFLVCLTYMTCALAPPGAQTSLMGLVTIPVKYFPYALLAIDVFNGRATECLSGMLVGHLWWWLVWGAGTGAGGVEQGRFATWVLAPGWLRNLFGEHEGERRATNRDGYRVHAPRERAEQAAGGRVAGHHWGSGQRLGSG